LKTLFSENFNSKYAGYGSENLVPKFLRTDTSTGQSSKILTDVDVNGHGLFAIFFALFEFLLNSVRLS